MERNDSLRRSYSYEALMRYAKLMRFGRIHTRIDASTGLHAIIAIHSTELGPALGGVRFYHYNAMGAALKDALRLAYMMTLKSAFSDIPHGGAKTVLLKPPIIKDHAAYFHSLGDFIHDLNGNYIAAMDVGTVTADMDLIAERTPYVIGAAKLHKSERDPSPSTALGVLRGVQAAVKFKLHRDTMEGVHVAIQGAGHVGYHLAKGLHAEGARISIADVNIEALEQCADEFGAAIIAADAIYDLPCDVFSPCAMGGVINGATYHRLRTPIIAGSANNQLSHHQMGQLLHEHNILYAPDFVINAGGLISAAIDYSYRDPNMANAKINQIYTNMLELFARAAHTNLPTETVAETIAIEKIQNHKDQREGIL